MGIFLGTVHIPVLLKEVVDVLAPKSGERVLDCTFGGGGHTRAILNASDCYVVALDRDPEARDRALQLKNTYNERFDFVLAKFSEISDLFKNKQRFDAVLFDFGVSSFQLDNAKRGFSFSKNAPLDMRMSKNGISAYDVVNAFSEEDLADILWIYGDEILSRKIASAIVKARKLRSIETTVQLANIVREIAQLTRRTKRHSRIDAATKTFQAIRIFVNDELREISIALEDLPKILNNGARIALISFHALEDRIVKNWAKSQRDILLSINDSVVKPTAEEISANPRSRSAILRSFWYNATGDVRKKREAKGE